MLFTADALRATVAVGVALLSKSQLCEHECKTWQCSSSQLQPCQQLLLWHQGPGAHCFAVKWRRLHWQHKQLGSGKYRYCLCTGKRISYHRTSSAHSVVRAINESGPAVTVNCVVSCQCCERSLWKPDCSGWESVESQRGHATKHSVDCVSSERR